MVRNLYYDVVIAGCGVAGLYTALSLPEDQKILMLSKEGIENCDSMLAQGGICVMRDEEDYEPYFEDTMKAGHYENRKESVEIMIRSSRGVIDHLLKLGRQPELHSGGSAFEAENMFPQRYYGKRNHHGTAKAGQGTAERDGYGIYGYD